MSSVLQSPVFTKQPGSIVYPVETLERNREVVFSCEAQGSPPPIYRWVWMQCWICPPPPNCLVSVYRTMSTSCSFRQPNIGKGLYLVFNHSMCWWFYQCEWTARKLNVVYCITCWLHFIYNSTSQCYFNSVGKVLWLNIIGNSVLDSVEIVWKYSVGSKSIQMH